MVENRRAMNFIFPLDLLFVMFGLASNLMAIAGALLKPYVPLAIFEAIMQNASIVIFNNFLILFHNTNICIRL
jgi:hypothetical protein